MKNKKYLILFICLMVVYIIFSKYLLIIHGEIISYIINPLVWISLAFFIFIFWGRKNKKYYTLKTDILYLIVAITVTYNVLYYLFGFIVGYAKNPYYFSNTGVFINLFSVLAIIISTEYIRNFLVSSATKLNYKKFLIIIGIIYVVLDVNLLSIYNGFNNYITMIDVILKEVVPSIALNALMIYLCTVAGFKATILYRIIIITPTLVFAIVPNFSWFFVISFQLSLILITYLIIQSVLNKKEHKAVITVNKKNSLLAWVTSLSLTALLVSFALGIYSVVPVVIITGSMKPIMHQGYIALVEKCSIEDIKEEDIIQYKIKNYTVIHRVIKIDIVNGKKQLTVKGDNNLKEDHQPVMENQVIGKINYYIPYLGYPTYLIKQFFGNNDNVEVEVGVD